MHFVSRVILAVVSCLLAATFYSILKSLNCTHAWLGLCVGWHLPRDTLRLKDARLSSPLIFFFCQIGFDISLSSYCKLHIVIVISVSLYCYCHIVSFILLSSNRFLPFVIIILLSSYCYQYGEVASCAHCCLTLTATTLEMSRLTCFGYSYMYMYLTYM